MLLSYALLIVGAASLVVAAPTLKGRAEPAPTDKSVVDSLTPFGQFSRAAYCDVDLTWTCGAACDALPGFVPYAVGGDGKAFPHFYVGFWPEENTAVVVHEGTDPREFMSILVDVNALFAPLAMSLFPTVDMALKVHDGFGDAHALSADTVLSTVKKIMTERSTNKVSLVGHSLGAALSTLDAIFLKINLPETTQFKLVLHGSPRVGNQEFADFVDSNFQDITRVNNQKDPIPIVPGRFLGYHHPSGEKHIDDDGVFFDCPGQDNTDDKCSTGFTSNIFTSNILDHLGPYSDVFMGSPFC